jgi:endonuclease/exonuclease/phosphatase (EEP) superfamily protein YafD
MAVVTRVLVALAWVAAAGLAVAVLGRLTHLDDVLWPYVLVNALTPVLFLPAYPAFAVGVATHRYALAAVALVAVVAHLVWLWPEVRPGGASAAPAGSAQFRLLTANLEMDNGRAGTLGRQIQADSPDVVVVEELSNVTYYGLMKSGALAGYHYSASRPQFGAFGAGVWSRYPLSDVAAPLVGGLDSLRVTVTLPTGQRFRLFAVHTLSPQTSSNVHVWRTQLADLRREVRATALPVVLAGDFNATRDMRPFRGVLAAGVTDAHDDVHAGWAPTWNDHFPVLPPVWRLDHVLISPQFTATGLRVGKSYGSDHLPLVADLALRPSS